jgi:cytochrome c-type biogenesis protein CcmF
MFWPGTIALWTALVAGLVSFGCYLAADRGGRGWMTAARTTYLVFTAAVLSTCGIMLTLILQHRFDVAYVASYSSRDLPLKYLVSSFWGGQEGSFLLWIFWGAIIGLVVARTARELEAPVMAIYVATFVSLVVIVCRQSPFRLLARIPEDGSSLNPLLQDNWMVIHPPVMFSGFASLSVPFAFAVAALWKKRWDGWITRALPWALFSFVTLGTAILMGGYWAYKTLGWGGYWGWDPVENTSLVPWLMTVALVHGMFLQRSRQKHRKVNLSLAILAYICILYGTFLTRSGVLADFSVHSFVDLGITGWLVADLVGFLVLGVALLAWRWKKIPTVVDEAPGLSRSVFFIIGIAALVGLSLVILLGTSSPLLTRLGSKPSQVSTHFYRVTTSPGGILLLVLFALVPFVSWKGETTGGLLKSSRRSLIVAAVALAVAFAAGARALEPLLFVGLAAFAFDMNLRAVVRKTKAGKLGGAGGYLAHVGVAVMMVGMVISGIYDVSKRVKLPKSVPVNLRGYSLKFTTVVPPTETSKQAMEVLVTTPHGKTFYAYPKMYLNTRTNQLMANPAIRKGSLFDLYISPQEYDPGAPARVGRQATLRAGQIVNVGGTVVRFDRFDMDRNAMASGSGTLHIAAQFTVTPPGGKPQPQTAGFVAHMDDSAPNFGLAAAIAGTRGSITVDNVSPKDGAVQVNIAGLSNDSTPAVPESLSVDVTTKPLISLVWGGFYIMMGGAVLALVRRSLEARASLVSETAPAGPAPSSSGSGSPRPLAPAPALSRSRR